MMKKLILCFLLESSMGCYTPPSTSEQHEHNVTKDTLLLKKGFDTLLKKQILNYKLSLDYEYNTQWKLENRHYSILHDWVNKFQEDTIINQLSSKEIDTTFIIHIEAGVNQNITPEIARKRMEDVRAVVSSMLGTNVDYDMEIIKVLRNLKYKEEHDIEIKINRLMY